MTGLKIIRLFCALLFLTIVINSSAQNSYKTTADLKLRSEPNSKSSSLVVVKKGEIVQVLEKTNKYWFKSSYGGKKGYLASKYLTQVVVAKPKVIDSPKEEEEPLGIGAILCIVFGLGGLVLLIFVIVAATKRQKKKVDTTQRENTLLKFNERTDMKKGISSNNSKNLVVEVTKSSNINLLQDNSVIDVSNQSYKITPSDKNYNLNTKPTNVPVWSHHYVYSYSEINAATIEQQNFYGQFKDNFKTGIYLDLEGNTNYAFILLFDLLIEYDNHKDLFKLKNQLQVLGKFYPKTKTYANNFLIEKMVAAGDMEGIKQVNEPSGFGYPSHDEWRLGTRYKDQLHLNNDQVKLLNQLWWPSNNFCGIEFCCIQVLRLYLALFAELTEKYKLEGTTLNKQFLEVADVIARKQLKYKAGSSNYKWALQSIPGEFYTNIFKHCENTVREHYSHKRKINTDTNYSNPEAKVEFETKILSKVQEILPQLLSTIRHPDEATEIKLNAQNTNRWKIKFDQLTANYKNTNDSQFIEEIIELGRLNTKNPALENIFFEASKFISKTDKSSSLTLYIYYLYHDLKSVNFDNKQLTKTIQKSLFKTNEQLHDFERVVSDLVKDRNLDKALVAVSDIYKTKRKKIQLDKDSIEQVNQKHTGTVELLNEYLQDEYEDENNSIKTQEINDEEVRIEITQKTDVPENLTYISEISFNENQIALLEVFVKSNFAVGHEELETYAKSNGVFKNHLIESINEICYDALDDILIEEEEDNYIINENYYQSILAK